MDVANKENVKLEGELPGFTMVLEGGNKISFFSVREEKAKEMAERYAEKEGDTDLEFNNIQEAVDYLRKLGKKALFHELGHIIYDDIDSEEWDDFIDRHPELKQKVMQIQKDKHGELISEALIKDEAFADFMVEFLSDGKIISRIGENEEAISTIKRMIFDL